MSQIEPCPECEGNLKIFNSGQPDEYTVCPDCGWTDFRATLYKKKYAE